MKTILLPHYRHYRAARFLGLVTHLDPICRARYGTEYSFVKEALELFVNSRYVVIIITADDYLVLVIGDGLTERITFPGVDAVDVQYCGSAFLDGRKKMPCSY